MGRVVLWWVLLCASAQALAQSSEMMDRLAALEKDPAKREQAYAAAEERILLCSKCHGKDGNSKRDYIPNLAGQNPRFRTIWDAYRPYRTEEFQWFRVAENSYDNFAFAATAAAN